MGETLTVRLFVQTQTYDIPCDAKSPGQWLLAQAQNIQRVNERKKSRYNSQSQDNHLEPLEILYNRTRRKIVDLSEPIGTSVSAMDVIDARTLREAPELIESQQEFPWSIGPHNSDDNMNDMYKDGLFFQQLHAYAVIGRRSPLTDGQKQRKEKNDAFLQLLHMYMSGVYTAPTKTEWTKKQVQVQEPNHSQYMDHVPTIPIRMAGEKTLRKYHSNSASVRVLEHTPQAFSDSDGSDDDEDQDNDSISSPLDATGSSSPSSDQHLHLYEDLGNRQDGFAAVFEVEFKQQSIGMKLGADETKQYAIVRECFENSEARKYPEIQSGVAIIAVNGQNVVGIGLSRILYRLREAPRPVVVRFGRLPSMNTSPMSKSMSRLHNTMSTSPNQAYGYTSQQQQFHRHRPAVPWG